MNMQNTELEKLLEETRLTFSSFDMQKNVNLLISEHCNLACGHCSTGAPFARRVYHPIESFFEWLDLLVEMKSPFEYISLTGGEPFLHPEMRNGSMVKKLVLRYPGMKVGATTNFFWANEDRITKYAPMIRQMRGGIGISVYSTIVDKHGGFDRFCQLVRMLMRECDGTDIGVEERSDFTAWQFHEDEREVKDRCGTHDCFILYPTGRLSHCSLVVGASNRGEFRSIVDRSKEAFFDLANLPATGMDHFLLWKLKYPIDICRNCTMWEGKTVPWQLVR
jgi:hypothetical protein